MKYVCALVVVEDIAKSKKLYEEILQQKVVADFGENVVFEGGFALHKRDHFKQLINGHEMKKGSNTFELYFEEDTLVDIEKKLIEKGFEFIHRVEEQPWRQQVMRLYDYDKNIIEIGESLEHLAYRLHTEKKKIEEIMSITHLSKEMVEKAIKTYL